MNARKMPFKVVTENGKQKFCPDTGKPLTPTDHHWVKDADGRLVALYFGNDELELARLTAAAPEMQSLLQDLQEYLCEQGGPAVELLERIDALLAKATGGENV